MYFNQYPYEIKLEWGRRGAREAAERGDIVIVVDVLSFSSTVTTALHHGAEIYPYPPNLDGKAFAEEIGGEYILGRAEAARANKPTLSPVTFTGNHSGKKYVLTSMNGAFCTWAAQKVPALLIGSLLNASSAAITANRLKESTGAAITVVPCGEQWGDVREHENSLRPAIEDYLGAGCILGMLHGKRSPEARVCQGAFLQAKDELKEIIWDSGSGRELRQRGFEADVLHCMRLNLYQTVPILKGDCFVEYGCG